LRENFSCITPTRGQPGPFTADWATHDWRFLDVFLPEPATAWLLASGGLLIWPRVGRRTGSGDAERFR